MDKPIFDVAGLAENYVFRSPKPRFVSSRELDDGLGSNRPFSASSRTRWLEALWANPRPKPLLCTGDPILPLHIKRPYPDKATQRQWKAEEPDLLKRVHEGDQGAARTLMLRHLPNLQQKYGSRLSAALEGFWRAVTLFKSDSNGLWAYVRWEVLGQVVRQREALGFGNSTYGFLYSDAAPLGVSSDPSADEITGGKAPRRQGAGTYRKGYCSNGVSQYSRNIAAYKQDFFHIRLGQKADAFALKCLRWMGRRRYADYLVNRETTCPPYQVRNGQLVEQQTTPDPLNPPRFAAADRYRGTPWSAKSLKLVVDAENNARRPAEAKRPWVQEDEIAELQRRRAWSKYTQTKGLPHESRNDVLGASHGRNAGDNRLPRARHAKAHRGTAATPRRRAGSGG